MGMNPQSQSSPQQPSSGGFGSNFMKSPAQPGQGGMSMYTPSPRMWGIGGLNRGANPAPFAPAAQSMGTPAPFAPAASPSQPAPMTLPSYIDEGNMDMFRNNQSVMDAYRSSGMMQSGGRMGLDALGFGRAPAAPEMPQQSTFSQPNMSTAVNVENPMNVGSGFSLPTLTPQAIPQQQRWTAPPPPTTPAPGSPAARPWFSAMLPQNSNWDN